MNELMVVSKEQCVTDPFSLVKWLAEDKMIMTEEDTDEKHLLALLNEYERVGAKNMVKQTSLRLAGHRLEKKGLFLYNIVHDGIGQIMLFKHNINGMVQVGSPEIRWKKVSLAKTKISVPLEVLQKLPDGSAGKLVMFEDYAYRKPDPIIAVPVSKKMFDWIPKNLYIGVAKW